MVASARHADFRNGDVSFWWSRLGGLPPARPALSGDLTVDVAIVGAGYTGLWSAYYLKQADPTLRIAIIEQHVSGFGASGRNGGWLSGEFGWSRERYARAGGRQSVIDFQRALWATVDEVIDVTNRHGIDADIVKGGALRYAINPAQQARLDAELAYERSWDVGADDLTALDASEVRQRIAVAGVTGGHWSPHAARIQPAKLVRGLSQLVEEIGVPIYERTTALRVSPHVVTTDHGLVHAGVIIRATEGFTAHLPGHHRDWLPMNSAMIATQPLPASMWEQIGWAGNEVLGDSAHAYLYAQRTADDRIAIGGRGVPYRFGSGIDPSGHTQQRTVEILTGLLHRAFPQVESVPIEHAWCGVLGVPRDWCAAVGLDRSTGLAWAGGYVGIGVATSNLAARTLTSLILRRDDALVRLPWVNRTVRKWEPEPLRWLGVHGLYRMYRTADAHEDRSQSSLTSPIARFASRLAGRH